MGGKCLSPGCIHSGLALRTKGLTLFHIHMSTGPGFRRCFAFCWGLETENGKLPVTEDHREEELRVGTK